MKGNLFENSLGGLESTTQDTLDQKKAAICPFLSTLIPDLAKAYQEDLGRVMVQGLHFQAGGQAFRA